MTNPIAMISRAIISFLALSAVVQANSLYLREAGAAGKKLETLKDGFSICAADYTAGISVVCDIASSYAKFYVDNTFVRREGVKPFTINGDNNGNAFAWTQVPTGLKEIKCEGEGGAEVKVTGTFECDASSTTVESETDTGGEPVTPMQPVGVDEKYCVTIPALSYDNAKPISGEWEQLDDGALSYLPNNDRTWTVGAGRAPVIYKFTVPIASTYGITMDSYAPHPTEHNDIWITFDSITLRGKDERTKEDIVDSGNKRPLKAYQNTARRSKIASSVDFNPHTFSTTQVLVPGKEYTITVGARSTKFKLYGLILFPCAGEECVRGKRHWQQYLGKCNV